MWNRNLTALYNLGYLTETWESSQENGAQENTIVHKKLEEGHTLHCPSANLEDNYTEEALLKPHTLKKVELEGSD